MPALNPVTAPEVVETDTSLLALCHVPPPVVLESRVVLLTHIFNVPVIGAGTAFMVSAFTVKQPVAAV